MRNQITIAKITMSNLLAIQTATLQARERLRDETIGTRVEKGRIQIVRVRYTTKGRSIVKAVSEYMPVAEVANYLTRM